MYGAALSDDNPKHKTDAKLSAASNVQPYVVVKYRPGTSRGMITIFEAVAAQIFSTVMPTASFNLREELQAVLQYASQRGRSEQRRFGDRNHSSRRSLSTSATTYGCSFDLLESSASVLVGGLSSERAAPYTTSNYRAIFLSFRSRCSGNSSALRSGGHRCNRRCGTIAIVALDDEGT